MKIRAGLAHVGYDACDGVVQPGRNPVETVQLSLEDVVRIRCTGW